MGLVTRINPNVPPSRSSLIPERKEYNWRKVLQGSGNFYLNPSAPRLTEQRPANPQSEATRGVLGGGFGTLGGPGGLMGWKPENPDGVLPNLGGGLMGYTPKMPSGRLTSLGMSSGGLTGGSIVADVLRTWVPEVDPSATVAGVIIRSAAAREPDATGKGLVPSKPTPITTPTTRSAAPPQLTTQQQATFLRLDADTGRPVVAIDGKEQITTWTIGNTTIAPGQNVLITTINGRNVMETPEQAKQRMQKPQAPQKLGTTVPQSLASISIPWMQLNRLPEIGGMWRRQVTQNGRDSANSDRRLHRQYLQIFSLDGSQYATIPLHYGGNGTDRIDYTMTGSWNPADKVNFVPPPDELTAGYAYGSRTRAYSNEFTSSATVEWVFPAGGRNLLYILAVRSGSDETTYSDFSEVEKTPRIDVVCDDTTPSFYQLALNAVYEPTDMAYTFTANADRFFAFIIGPTSLRSVSVPTGVRTQMAAFLPQWQNSDRIYGFPVSYSNSMDDVFDTGTCSLPPNTPTASTEYQTVTRQRLGTPTENWGAHFKLKNMCFPAPSVGNILAVYGPGMYAAWREGATAYNDLIANPGSYPDPASVIAAYMASDPVPGGSVQIENTADISTSRPVSHWSVGYRSFSQVSSGGWTPGTNVETQVGALNASSNSELAAPSGMTVTFTGDDQKLLMTWDWGNPAYCRAQALALGFSESDLTP
jgi:hypothetical protein